MKIAVIGATGNVGQRIVDEALSRDHSVTAISRDPSKIAARDGVTAAAGDVNNPETLAEVLKGHDAVISSVMFVLGDPHKLIAAVRKSDVKRYLVVGGAGSLLAAPDLNVVDTPDFPKEYHEEASKGRDFLNVLKSEVDDLDWTMLSPSALFVPGERTGTFRLGKDDLLVGADGKSWITYEDYAIAFLDELENPMNIQARFTVGY